MKVFVSINVLALLALLGFLSCATPDRVSESIPATGHKSQIRAFSVSGNAQASLIVDGKRDFRATIDGGETWRTIPSPAVEGGFECATMTDAQNGWAVSHDGKVFATSNGGADWRTVADLKAQASGDFSGAQQIEFIDDSVGWILESLSLWLTTDGGITWHRKLSVSSPGVKGQPTRLQPLDANTLIVTGTEGQTYVTRDSGQTWKIDTLAGDVDFNDVSFIDPQTGWISGARSGDSNPPVLFHTADGGNSWTDVSPANHTMIASSIAFEGNEGWLAGRRRITTDRAIPFEGVLLHTTDRGNHWTQVEIDSDDPFFTTVRFSGNQSWWLAGRDSVYRTDDGGKTWRKTLSLPPVKS